MSKARTRLTYAQFSSVMEELGSEMDSVDIGTPVTSNDSTTTVNTLSCSDDGGSSTSLSVVDDDPKTDEATEASANKVVGDATDQDETQIVSEDKPTQSEEEEEVTDEDLYLYTKQTNNVIVRHEAKPSVFVKGTKLDPIEYTFIDTVDSVKAMLDDLLKWHTTGVSLFVDLEGNDLGSYSGDTRLMAVFHKLTRHTYLLDISELGQAAFNTKGAKNTSLKSVLESRHVVKGLWDARNDAAGLYREFGITLDGVVDVQLMVCKATGYKYQPNRPRLDMAIDAFCEMSDEVSARMTNTKEAGKRMWKPALGGTFAVFSDRPLHPRIIAYCVNDTYFLDDLYEHALGRISADGLREVNQLCHRQLKATTRASYQHAGRVKARNPFYIPGDHYDDYE